MRIPKKVKAIFMTLVMLLSMSLNGLVASASTEDNIVTGPGVTGTLGSINIQKFDQPDTSTGLPNDGTQIPTQKILLC